MIRSFEAKFVLGYHVWGDARQAAKMTQRNWRSQSLCCSGMCRSGIAVFVNPGMITLWKLNRLVVDIEAPHVVVIRRELIYSLICISDSSYLS